VQENFMNFNKSIVIFNKTVIINITEILQKLNINVIDIKKRY